MSHFQLLRELSALGLNDMEHVKPFKNEPDSEDGGDTVLYTDEYPTSYGGGNGSIRSRNGSLAGGADVEDVKDDKDSLKDYDPIKGSVSGSRWD